MMASWIHDPRKRGVPLIFVEPCYWVVDRLGTNSVLLDFGLGFNADFSQAMIAKYGLRSVGFDPTRKHQSALRAIESTAGGRFRYEPAAIGGASGTVEFHESVENVSGSLLANHCNVRHDTIRRYPVELITIAQAFERAGAAQPDVVKMDIEGPEYDALDAASDDTIRGASQWVIEFHHDVIDDIPFSRTRKQIERFERLGFRAFTRDSVNFLFYR